jgi:hypothetical protein
MTQLRYAGRLTALMVLLSSVFIARVGAGAELAAAAPPVSVQVYVAYADNRTAAAFYPNPWYYTPNTYFAGTHGPAYDTGAIMIVNTGQTAVVLSQGASVSGFDNGKVYQLWDGIIAQAGKTIAPGGRFVLTQTTTCSGDNVAACSNFDTGASTTGTTPTNNIPVIHLTLNGVAQSFSDTGQILNTGGVDVSVTLHRNASTQWRLVGTTNTLFPGGSGVMPAAVSTVRNDNSRTGLASGETTLNTTNVSASTFGKLFAYTVDGTITAQPLFVRDVPIPTRGLHDLVVVATSNDSVYAFDAETNGAGGGLLWGPVSMGNPSPPFGVAGTPVIDTATNTIYLVSKNLAGAVDVALLHALDLTSGVEKFGGPVTIAGTVAGTGDDSSGGKVAFVSQQQLQRPGLLLVGSTLYVAFGSVGDRNPNHGWIFGYDAAAGLEQISVFNTTPNAIGSCNVDPATSTCPPTPPTGSTVLTNSLCPGTKNPGWNGFLPAGGAIWMSGSGPAADANGIYIATGNGFFNIADGNYADSVLKLSPGTTAQLQVADYFTPANQQYLMCNDDDFGAGAPLLLPGTNPALFVMISKRGDMYLLSRITGEMGHYNACSSQALSCDHVVQAVGGALEATVTSSPAYFNGAIYAQGSYNTLKKFSLQSGLFSPVTPTAQTVGRFTFPATPSISYDATAADPTPSGIVWSLERRTGSPSILHAYTTDTLREIYRSDTQGTRDTLGATGSFSVPTIAAGKVFVGTSTQLVVYGGRFF